MNQQQLIGVTEIGTILGVSRQRADQISRAKGFPEAAAELANGRVWRAADVLDWARSSARWPSLSELYRDTANVAQHWLIEVQAHAPADDGFRATLSRSTRSALVMGIEFGTDTTPMNAQLQIATERLAGAIARKDPEDALKYALEAESLAKEIAASDPSHRITLDPIAPTAMRPDVIARAVRVGGGPARFVVATTGYSALMWGIESEAALLQLAVAILTSNPGSFAIYMITSRLFPTFEQAVAHVAGPNRSTVKVADL